MQLDINEQYVEERLITAARTLRRLPEEKVQGYRSSWPPMIYDVSELLNQQPVMRLGPPLPEDITEMEEVIFKWLMWLDPDQRKLVWLRAEKVRWKLICLRFYCDRTTAWRKYKTSLSIIASHLRTREQVKKK